VIVRISQEGQYEISKESEAELDELDHRAVESCEAGSEDGFRTAFDRLLEFVRTNGRLVDADHLGGSDLILPPPDVSLEEARAEFRAEGLIPE
jgi:hypothetical protein